MSARGYEFFKSTILKFKFVLDIKKIGDYFKKFAPNLDVLRFILTLSESVTNCETFNKL